MGSCIIHLNIRYINIYSFIIFNHVQLEILKIKLIKLTNIQKANETFKKNRRSTNFIAGLSLLDANYKIVVATSIAI